MSDPKDRVFVDSNVKESHSPGSEVSGCPVDRYYRETNYSDGSKHCTESIVTKGGSRRMSWDVDKDGNVSNRHCKKIGLVEPFKFLTANSF